MSEKLFKRLLIAVMAAGIISSAVLVGVTAYYHENCSIISFVANWR